MCNAAKTIAYGKQSLPYDDAGAGWYGGASNYWENSGEDYSTIVDDDFDDEESEDDENGGSDSDSHSGAAADNDELSERLEQTNLRVDT